MRHLGAVKPDLVAPESTVTLIGEHFFSDYLLPFELASVLLLMALIGAIIIARRETVVGEDTAIVGEQPPPVLELPERPREPVA